MIAKALGLDLDGIGSGPSSPPPTTTPTSGS